MAAMTTIGRVGASLLALLLGCGPVYAPISGAPVVPTTGGAGQPPVDDGLGPWTVERSFDDFLFGAELHFPMVRRGDDAVQRVESDYDVAITLSWNVEVRANLIPTTPLAGVAVIPPRGVVELARFDVAAPAEDTTSFLRFTAYLGDPAATATPYEYALPLDRATQAEIIQGNTSFFSHNGLGSYALDFRIPVGTPVRAMRPGLVVALNESSATSGLDVAYKDYRFVNFVAVRHDDGTVGEYLHLDTGGVDVGVGDTVMRNQVIAASGNTGYTTTPHLHVHVGVPTPDGQGFRTLEIQYAVGPGQAHVPDEGSLYQGWE